MIDPLLQHADARLYVPIESGESALAALGMSLDSGCSPVLLSGPTGIGKSLLLRVLSERQWTSFRRTRVAARLPELPEDLAGTLLHLLFGTTPPRNGDAAEAKLLESLRAQREMRTLLLVDDIQRTSEPTVAALARLGRRAKRDLSIVAAGTSCEDLSGVTVTLAAGFTVFMPESLPETELEAIFDAIVAHPGLSQRLRHRLLTTDRGEVLHAAGGNPRLLKNEIARRDQDRSPRPPAPPELGEVAGQLPLPEAPEVRSALSAQFAHTVASGLAEAVASRLTRAREASGAARARALHEWRRFAARAADAATAAREGARSATRRAVDASRAVSLRSWRSARGAGAAVQREAARLSSEIDQQRALLTARATESATRAGVSLARTRDVTRAAAGRRARSARLATGRAAVACGRASLRAARDLRGAAQRAKRLTTSAEHSVARVSRRTAASVALPVAGLLLAVSLLSLGGPHGASHRVLPAVAPTAAPAVAPAIVEPATLNAVTPAVSSPVSLPQVPVSVPTVKLQVNARPWARVWIDGVDLGATPFQHPLAPGAYDLEAEFPNGRRIHRNIQVTPERRFVSLP